MKSSYSIKRQFPHLHRLIQLTGGTKAIRESGYIKLENEPYLPLTLEIIGEGMLRAKGYAVTCTIAISHTYTQNGDLMRDPEVTLDYSEEHKFFIPLNYTQDSMGRYVEAIYHDPSGELCQRTGEHRSLSSFMSTWQQNLKDQGFLEVAKNRTHPKHTWIERTSNT